MQTEIKPSDAVREQLIRFRRECRQNLDAVRLAVNDLQLPAQQSGTISRAVRVLADVDARMSMQLAKIDSFIQGKENDD